MNSGSWRRRRLKKSNGPSPARMTLMCGSSGLAFSTVVNITMAGESTGTYLNSRCAISTFKKLAEPLLDVLSDESNDLLRNAGLLQYFLIPDLPQNIPLLYRLIRLYRPKKQAFLLGKYYVKMTVNEVALILGLPNRGEEFCFKRVPFSKENHTHLLKEINELVIEEITPDVESRRLRVLVKYVLCKLFFPLKSLRIPECLLDFDSLDEFRKYNWPLAIHKFLHSQFESLYTLAKSREDPSSLGYLEGCSIILVIWFFEHTNMQVPTNDLFSPRMGRWGCKGSFTFKFCLNLNSILYEKDQVLTSFSDYYMNERELLGAEEEESSFEVVSKARHDKKSAAQKEKDKLKLMDKKREKEIRKYVRSEIKSSELKVKKEIRNLYEYCRERFDAIYALLQSSKSNFPVPSVGTPLPSEQPEDIICIEESTPQSKLRKRKNVSQADATMEVIFPGRQHISKEDAKRIDSVLTPTPGRSKKSRVRDTIFESGNISMSRAAFTDMLDKGWLSDTHIDAFAVVLSNRRDASPTKWKPFIYVSPNYAYYKRCGVPFTMLISEITPATVAIAEYIFMPVHLGVHWTLLVGNLRELTWYFYDSLPSPTHRKNLSSLIVGLHADTGESLPEIMSKRPIEVVHSAPKQQNGHDCGMFVLKYMETIAKVKNVCWEGCSEWQSKMPKYRAKLATEMIKMFCDG